MDAEGVTTFDGWDVTKDGMQTVGQEKFITPLIKAVQELSAEIANLKSEINLLKGIQS
jgi:uncharacterized small protein (DUF1192 family)